MTLIIVKTIVKVMNLKALNPKLWKKMKKMKNS